MISQFFTAPLLYPKCGRWYLNLEELRMRRQTGSSETLWKITVITIMRKGLRGT